MVPITYYIALSTLLFSIGAVGVLIRRNAIVIFMSVELMLNSAKSVICSFCSFLWLFERPDFCIFCHGGCGCRSCCWPGFDCGDLPFKAKYQCR